jgi:hypothetical protein
MEFQPVPIPDNRNYEYAYNQSYQIAINQLAAIKNYEELCRNSDTRCTKVNGQTVLELKYIHRLYQIIIAGSNSLQIQIKSLDKSETLSLKEQILILHYVLNAKGTPLSGQEITFKELPEGSIYFRTFTQRTIKHLITHFSDNPAKLLEAAQSLSGQKANFGDGAATIFTFSRVPITFVVWKGDSEFPADGNVFYDSTVTDYLPTEDIIVLSETLVWKLVRFK